MRLANYGVTAGAHLLCDLSRAQTLLPQLFEQLDSLVSPVVSGFALTRSNFRRALTGRLVLVVRAHYAPRSQCRRGTAPLIYSCPISRDACQSYRFFSTGACNAYSENAFPIRGISSDEALGGL